jgi:hypothetical protein
MNQLTLVAYEREKIYELLREATPGGLRAALGCGAFGSRLTSSERHELFDLLTEWEQRALGQVTIRDALLVDPARGQRIYALICAAQTVVRQPLPAAAAVGPGTLSPQQARSLGAARLAERAEAEALAIYVLGPSLSHPLPVEDLAQLLPPAPQPIVAPEQPFEQPVGLRRWVAATLASVGALNLALPLLSGTIPERAAGLPLALLTLALLIGIRASWAGYLGSLLIWLVPNLPGFHYSALHLFWPAIPLLAIGLLALALDRHVRAMWRWLRRQFT